MSHELHWFFRAGSALVRQTMGRYLSVRCEGLNRLPPQTPFILAANHVSTLDPVLFSAYVLPRIRCMMSPAATKGLFFWPLGVLLRRMGAFVVDRQNNRNLSSIRAMLKTLRVRPVLIFPEGGIARERDQRRSGIGYIAVKSGVPIIPAAIIGTEKALPKGGRWIKRARVTLRFGSPLDLDVLDHDQITDRVMEEILRLKSMGEGEQHAS